MTTGVPGLRGVIPVIAMPFADDGSVDHPALARECEYLVTTGAHGIAFGFGSELPGLTDRERDEALGVAVGTVADRVPVMAAVNAASTHAAVERITAAAERGAAFVMLTPPRGSEPAIRSFFTEVDPATAIPMVIQDAPEATGVVMSETILVELATLDRVAALKVETADAVGRIASLREALPSRCTVLGGSGGLEMLSELRSGSHGTMPGPAFAGEFVLVWRLEAAGRHADAARLFGALQPLLVVSSRGSDAFLFIQKEVLRRRGVIPSARLRAPAGRLSSRIPEELDHLLPTLDEVMTQMGTRW